jgi:hypothetical protein
MLVFIERKQVGRLGADPSAPLVVSRRSNLEKEPWKSLPSIENRVEKEFIHTILLGESVLPYRLFHPFEGVVPVMNNGTMLDAEAAANRGFDGLFGWMRKAEAVWDANKRSEKMKLTELFDYFGQLSAQFPTPNLRVVYAKAGSHPAACILRDRRSLIENLLYWSAVETDEEALYLSAILNSETARAQVEAMQARGQYGARHFDKVFFNLPIARFDPKLKFHLALAEAAAQAEKTAAKVELPEGVKFQRARGLIRGALKEASISQRIDDLVAQVLGDA